MIPGVSTPSMKIWKLCSRGSGPVCAKTAGAASNERDTRRARVREWVPNIVPPCAETNINRPNRFAAGGDPASDGGLEIRAAARKQYGTPAVPVAGFLIRPEEVV